MSTTRPASDWDAYLDPDEEILWQARPDSRITWRGGEIWTVLIGVIILAFIAFGLWDTWRHSDGSVPFTLGSAFSVLVFMAIGILVMLSGPVGLHIVREGTWYTLTTRRAIIAHWPVVFGISVYRGLDCYPITAVSVVGSDVDGLMTAHFARLSNRHTFVEGDGWRRAGHTFSLSEGNKRIRDHPVGFERIADAAQVADLCRKVQADPQHMDWTRAQ